MGDCSLVCEIAGILNNPGKRRDLELTCEPGHASEEFGIRLARDVVAVTLPKISGVLGLERLPGNVRCRPLACQSQINHRGRCWYQRTLPNVGEETGQPRQYALINIICLAHIGIVSEVHVFASNAPGRSNCQIVYMSEE